MPLLLLVALLHVADVRLVNVTIDDTAGDARTGLRPQYISTDGWDGGTDPRAFNSTYHLRNSDLPGNISISFTGTRIYTYFGFWPATVVDLSFFLNGDFAGRYTRRPGGEPGPIYWVYGEMAFASDQLPLAAPLAEHTLLVVSPGGEATTLQFDYAIYTTEDSETDGDPLSGTASSSVSTPTATQGTHSTTIPTRPSTTVPRVQFTTSPDRVTQSSTASRSTHNRSTARATRASRTRSTALGAAIGGGAGLVFVLVCGALFIWRGRPRSPDPPRPFFARQNLLPPTDVADKSRLWGTILAKPAAPSPSGSADLKVQLERVRAENEWQLGEIALLRRAAAPPSYSGTGLAARDDGRRRDVGRRR